MRRTRNRRVGRAKRAPPFSGEFSCGCHSTRHVALSAAPTGRPLRPPRRISPIGATGYCGADWAHGRATTRTAPRIAKTTKKTASSLTMSTCVPSSYVNLDDHRRPGARANRDCHHTESLAIGRATIQSRTPAAMNTETRSQPTAVGLMAFFSAIPRDCRQLHELPSSALYSPHSGPATWPWCCAGRAARGETATRMGAASCPRVPRTAGTHYGFGCAPKHPGQPGPHGGQARPLNFGPRPGPFPPSPGAGSIMAWKMIQMPHVRPSRPSLAGSPGSS